MKKLIAFLLVLIIVMTAIPMNMSAITYDDFSTVLSPNATIGFNKTATSKMNEEIRYIGAYPYYHYSAAAGSYKNNELVFSFKPLDVALSDYPFIKVSYRTDTTSSIIDVSMSTPAGEKWMNKHPSAVNNGGWNTFIVNYNDIVGSTAAFPSPGERNITIKLKPFGTDCTLEKNCYFDISYVALFKTEAEAEAFTYNEFYSNAGSGYSSNILTPMAIYSAFGSASAVSDISYTMLTSESSYVRYVAAPGTYNNNQLTLSFTHDAFSLTEYPYVNICYKTDSPASRFDISMYSQKGENWLTSMPALKNDGTMTNVIFSINKMTGNSAVSAPDAGDMSIKLILKPWGAGDKTITKSSYFDIYYIGFFKTELEATEFLYPGDSEYVFGYDDNLVPDYRFASKPVVRKYIDEADARSNEIIHANNTVPYENHLALTGVTGEYTGDYKDSAYVLAGASGNNAASSYVTFTQNDVDLKNFPYVKLGYTTDSASSPAFAYKNSSGTSTFVSASNGVYDLSSASSIKSFLIYPFGSTSRTLASNEHFSLKYVGVFKTKAEAEAYTYKGEHGDNMTDTHIIYTANLLDPASTATGTKYFVSSSGSSSANGTSPSTPWSFEKFVSSAPSNCTVFFKRGDSFRYTGTLATKSNTVYTSYGYGDKPKLIASIDGTGADKWEATSKANVWRFKQTIKNSDQSGDIGHIRINGGELWGIKVCAHNTDENRTDNGSVFNGRTYIKPLANVAVDGGLGLYNDLEFHHDYSTGYLYLYCADGNPGSVFKSIEIADKGNAVRNENYVTFDNFYIAGAGSHGVAGGNGYGAVSNCFFDWIGGSIQALSISTSMPVDPVRFGNAVEIYGNAYDFTIKNCFASQIYDCCWTVQYMQAAEFKNVFMYDNVSEFANSGLEVWQGGGTNDNMHLYDNYTMFGGYGWSHQRPLKDGNFFYGGTSINSTVFTNCSVDNNVNILSSTYGNLVAAVGSTRYNFNNNVYILGENKYYARAPYDTENGTGSGANIPYNFANLHRVYSRGTESGSTFYYVPADIMSIGDDPYEIFNVSSNPIKSISIDKDYVLLKSGEFANIKVSFSPSNATDSELFYSSTNENIASINSDGRINAIVPGYATITVSSIDSGVSASVDVFVVSAPDTGTLCSLDKADGDNTNVLFAGDSLLLGEKSLPALMKEDYHITSEVYASGKALAESGICEAIKNSELDYDIAFLFVGLNDFVNCTDTNDFKASVTDIASAVYENNYNAKIILVTPPMITSKNNSAGVSLSEYVNAVNEVNDEVYADVADLYANGVNDYVLYDKNSNPGQTIGSYIHNDMVPGEVGSSLLYADLITELEHTGTVKFGGFDSQKYILKANELTASTNSGMMRYGMVGDITGSYLRFVPSGNVGTANDNTYIQIDFPENGHKLMDNPILKVYYRSNVAASAAKIDLNVGLLKDGSVTRMWSKGDERVSYTKDGTLQSFTVDLTKLLAGGDKISSVYDADEGTPVKYIRFKIYDYQQALTNGDYFDIKSIAFYSSVEAAENNGMPTFEKPAEAKKGDVNGDGVLNLLDVIAVSRSVADWNGYKYNIQFQNADVNTDGYVNLLDTIIIARYMANWSGYDKYFS